MTSASSPHELGQANDKRRQAWAKRASKYDKSIGFFERRIFGTGHREWACSKAVGEVLEVAVGTGLNLPHYPEGTKLTGIDLSPEMLEIARTRAHDLGRQVELREGDAHALPFPDASFDAVVCTYSLCNIPNPALAVSEMKRVLRPDGKLILVDHIRSAVKPIFWFQRAVEFFSMRFEGEYLTRRPLEQVFAAGFEVTQRDRLARGGVVERLVATKANG